MYDRFCTLDKEKANNNDSSGKKVTYFNILLSLPETLFHRMLTKFHLNIVYSYLISSTSPHPICLLRNTVNAPMYPNVKCYLYFNIHNYIFLGGKKSVFLGVPITNVLATDGGKCLNQSI